MAIKPHDDRVIRPPDRDQQEHTTQCFMGRVPSVAVTFKAGQWVKLKGLTYYDDPEMVVRPSAQVCEVLPDDFYRLVHRYDGPRGPIPGTGNEFGPYHWCRLEAK